MIRYTDIYPAGVNPMPDGVPQNVKIRAVITDKWLTFGWLYGSQIQRLDIPLEPGDVGEDVTYNGGTVKGITVGRVGACSTCGGGRRMLSWQPFPDEPITEEPRKQEALQQRVAAGRDMSGLIPVRYSRSR